MTLTNARSKGKRSKQAAETTGNEALDKALLRLRELQGEAPMVPLQVDGHVVAEIIAAWTRSTRC